ncbi:MAG: ribosome silencing factor [Bacteroidetes bacterium]|nr:ribosome silencing factor [Bacteroidota bacterium]
MVVAGMEEMKALDIVIIDLRKIQNSICDFFVIASGNSSTHVDAIAGSLEKEVKQTTGEYPWKREGFANSEWILVDYVSVIAHVFQEHTREFYNLEDLWADAAITKIENKN